MKNGFAAEESPQSSWPRSRVQKSSWPYCLVPPWVPGTYSVVGIQVMGAAAGSFRPALARAPGDSSVELPVKGLAADWLTG